MEILAFVLAIVAGGTLSGPWWYRLGFKEGHECGTADAWEFASADETDERTELDSDAV